MRLLLILITTLSIGCGTFQIPPPGNTASRINRIPAEDRTLNCPIFVVTDRDAEPGQIKHILFKNNTSNQIKGAKATVQIDQFSSTTDQLWWQSISGMGISPKLIDLDSLGSLWSSVPVQHGTINPLESVEALEFARLIDEQLRVQKTDEIVVFVHGYNTDIDGNAGILAGLWHYSGRGFVPVQYEWPSNWDLFSYNTDKQNAARSIRSLRMLIQFLSEKTSAKRINILGHSAGTVVVIHALHQLRLKSQGLTSDDVRARYRVGSVVLAAPDIDTVEYLNTVMDGLLDVPQRLSIYMSSQDLALKISRYLFGNNRLGFISSARVYSGESHWLAKLVNGNAIDIAPALKNYPADWLGHSYFYRNPIVAEDIIRALLTDDTPEVRGLKREENMPGIWVLPDQIIDSVGAD